MDKLGRTLKRNRQGLLSLPNVVGVARGQKMVRGESTKQEAVVVLVNQKMTLKDLRQQDVVPRVLAGVPTDVIEVGELRLLEAQPLEAELAEDEDKDPGQPGGLPSRTRRQRPARPGVSVGHYQITAGTLGALVKDRRTGELLILSNNHVLANATDGRDRRAKPGDPILQPGPYDGGTMDDTIAHLDRFIPLVREYARPTCRIANFSENLGNLALTALAPPYRLEFRRRMPRPNLVDAAVARLTNPDVVVPEILELGPVRGLAPEAKVGTVVRKSGRSSGLNQAQILALDATLRVSLGEKDTAIFAGQLVAGPMAQPGDSGSLVVDLENRAVGLLFAGSYQATIINPIQTVLDTLAIELVM
ncbi:MAG: hypothetical protein H5U02_11250 [Clostridia bacterium]|nr:hypothetical protein [Clostridia bacterium]